MVALAVIGILYGALVALVQKDMKRLVAFSTVSSLSFCILGIFCFSVSGVDGAIYQILNEGISVGALLHAARLYVRALRNLRNCLLRRASQTHAQPGDLVRHQLRSP